MKFATIDWNKVETDVTGKVLALVACGLLSLLFGWFIRPYLTKEKVIGLVKHPTTRRIVLVWVGEIFFLVLFGYAGLMIRTQHGGNRAFWIGFVASITHTRLGVALRDFAEYSSMATVALVQPDRAADALQRSNTAFASYYRQLFFILFGIALVFIFAIP